MARVAILNASMPVWKRNAASSKEGQAYRKVQRQEAVGVELRKFH